MVGSSPSRSWCVVRVYGGDDVGAGRSPARSQGCGSRCLVFWGGYIDVLRRPMFAAVTPCQRGGDEGVFGRVIGVKEGPREAVSAGGARFVSERRDISHDGRRKGLRRRVPPVDE